MFWFISLPPTIVGVESPSFVVVISLETPVLYGLKRLILWMCFRLKSLKMYLNIFQKYTGKFCVSKESRKEEVII